MKLTHDELEFLSAWAREEWEPACYQLPAHRLQLAHGVSAAQLIGFIKAWTEAGLAKIDLFPLSVYPGSSAPPLPSSPLCPSALSPPPPPSNTCPKNPRPRPL